MNLLCKILTVSFLSLLLAGCAPDEGAACDHMMDVMKNDPEKPDFLTDKDRCIDRMEKMKNRHGVNSYRREVTCALAADTAYKMRTCLEKEARFRNGPKV